jgi:hypothetical protein
MRTLSQIEERLNSVLWCEKIGITGVFLLP